MMATMTRGLLFGGLVLGAVAPLQALDFKDGRWRVVIETESRGMAVKIPPKYQYEHCLTQKDFNPDLKPLHASCRTIDTVTQGDEITWNFACREQGANVHGHGRLKFSGLRFQGTLSTISEYPQHFEVIQTLNGRYLGVCKPGAHSTQPRKPPTQLPDYDETK